MRLRDAANNRQSKVGPIATAKAGPDSRQVLGVDPLARIDHANIDPAVARRNANVHLHLADSLGTGQLADPTKGYGPT